MLMLMLTLGMLAVSAIVAAVVEVRLDGLGRPRQTLPATGSRSS
jgi:hypothetical protein